MTSETPVGPNEPVGPGPVARNSSTAEFFDAAARGELLLSRCQPHGHWNRPQALSCLECGAAELLPAPSSGRARLVSWVVLPDGRTPAIVELDEGPWWWTLVVGTGSSELTEGVALQVRFEQPEGSEAVPVFAPA